MNEIPELAMMGLLHTGYEMPLSREVKISKKIKNK